jgi:hypothetical protein
MPERIWRRTGVFGGAKDTPLTVKFGGYPVGEMWCFKDSSMLTDKPKDKTTG